MDDVTYWIVQTKDGEKDDHYADEVYFGSSLCNRLNYKSGLIAESLRIKLARSFSGSYYDKPGDPERFLSLYRFFMGITTLLVIIGDSPNGVGNSIFFLGRHTDGFVYFCVVDHCSCYGLDEDAKPKQHTLEQLKMMDITAMYQRVFLKTASDYFNERLKWIMGVL